MEIHRIKRLTSATYLLEAERGLVLIDAGFLWHAWGVLRAIRDLGRRDEDLRLVLVTHPHLDHFGGLADLRDYTEFEIACHPDAITAVTGGGKHVSPALKARSKAVELLAKVSFPITRFRGAGPAFGLPDGADMRTWGIPGRILHTPGHTESCLSLVLDDGTAFTGDLIMGKQFYRDSPNPPTMAISLERTFASWRKLLAAGATRILPAHGEPFSAEELRETMRRVGVALPGADAA